MRLGVLGSDTPRAIEAIATQLAEFDAQEETLVVIGTPAAGFAGGALEWAAANGVGYETRTPHQVAAFSERILAVIDPDEEHALLADLANSANLPKSVVTLDPAALAEEPRTRRARE